MNYSSCANARTRKLGISLLTLSLSLLVGACVSTFIQSAAATSIAVTPATAENNNVDARALAQTIVNAYGGEKKLKEIDALAFRSKGKIKEYSSISQAENTFDCTMVSQGNKLRIEMNVMGQSLITAYDGKEGWLQQGDQVFPADPATVERIENEIKHSLEHQLLAMLDPASELTFTGSKESDGKFCDVLVLKTDNDQQITLFADKETHLILRTEFMGTDTEQGIKARIANVYLDYRPLLGTQEPFKIIEYTNDQKTTEALQDTAEVDPTISDSFFTMPTIPRLARLAQGPVKVPFEYGYNQILVKLRINGDKDATFIVDSGASQSMLDEKFALTVGSPEKSNYSITTGGGSMHMNFMVAKTVELGELTMEKVSFGVADGSAFTQLRDNKPAGILGANILKRFLTTIDYRDRTITFADPNDVHVPAGAAVIATKPAMGNLGIVIEGTLDRSLKIPFLVDTGAAFNNISATMVKPLVNEKLLPVSKILGLDGQQVDVGAVQFDTLRLGSEVVQKPVFSVAVAPPGSKGAGIITSNTLAILGNPLWSQFRLTIDYRHNRIFLEETPQLEAFNSVSQQLKEIRTRIHKDKNVEHALADCKKLIESEAAKDQAIAALIHAEIGALLVDQARATTDRDLVFQAKKEFESAQQLASTSKDPTVQARVYATLARHIAEMDPSLTGSVKSMIGRAIKLAPMDPEVLTSAAIVLKGGNPTLIERVADQALSGDPANWDALWFRYKLAQELKETEATELVAAQLRRYYPNAPEVLALEEHKQPVTAAKILPIPATKTSSAKSPSAKKTSKPRSLFRTALHK